MPEISVIMPAYNAVEYLREAVDSILNQTFKDFELIVIDDCSTDNTPDILASYSDPRIRVLRNGKNMERSYSKNRGIAEAKADLIAFLDADDYAVPGRLATQLDFLKKNPQITLCSSYFKIMGTDDIHGTLTAPDDIKARLLLGCPIAQSGVMLHKSVLNRLDEVFRDAPIPSEDYDLWARISRFTDVQFAIIPMPLVHYRLANTKPVYFEKQRLGACYAYKTQLDAFGVSPDSGEFFIHRLLSSDTIIENAAQLDMAEMWLKQIVDHNLQVEYYNQESLLKSVKNAWLHFCHRSSRKYLRAAFVYFISPFGEKGLKGLGTSLRMVVKFFYFRFMSVYRIFFKTKCI